MGRRLLAVLFTTLCIGVMTASVAFAADYATNADCFVCHAPGGSAMYKSDFHVVTPLVNYSTACIKCHWEQTGLHPFHNSSWNCSSCHAGWGRLNFAAMPKQSVAGKGHFNSISSAAANSDTLHSIHSQSTWASTARINGPGGYRECGNCHAPAACTTCHDSGIATNHSAHTWSDLNSAFWPVVGPTGAPHGLGATSGIENEPNVTTTETCSNPSCHDFSSGAVPPVVIDDNITSKITYTPSANWIKSSMQGYVSNTFRISNTLGASAVFTFTGQAVEFVTDRGNNRGFVKITLDGGAPSFVDLYASATEKGYVAYNSGKIALASHTLVIEVPSPYQANGASRGNYVLVDAFRVYPKLSAATTKTCLGCHTDETLWASTLPTAFTAINRSMSHLGGTVAPPIPHAPTSGNVAQSAETTSYAGTITCGDCHAVTIGQGGLVTEHTASTSAQTTYSLVDACTDCHTAPVTVPFKSAPGWGPFKDTNRACAACHTGTGAGAALAIHTTAVTTKHNQSTAGCVSGGIGCHNGNNDTQVGAVNVPNSNIHKDCKRCHDVAGVTTVTASNQNTTYAVAVGKTTCTGATGCHSAVNYTTAVHDGFGGPANGTDAAHHSAAAGAQAGATYTYAGKSAACSACHSMLLGTEHARASSTMTGAGANDCLRCHNDSATVANIIKADWANKAAITACSDCHANTDVTSAATAHLNVGNHAATLANTGCTGVGGGCHGATANYDLTTVHVVSNSCTYSTCHSATTFNPATKTCSSVGCHVVANYNTTTYVHNGTRGNIDGNDTTYHGAGTNLGNATYTYAGKSAACSACHSMVLGTEHARASSTFSGAGTNGCTKCHNDSATVIAVVTSKWLNRNATTGCSDCHANTDVTSAATAHLNVGNHVATLANTGCTAIGAGCHGATASYDLTTVHVVGSSCTYATCHSATTFNPATKTCSSVGCHVVANYNTTTYVHNGTRGNIDGNDTTYHVAGTNQGSASYTLNGKSAACTACHSMVLGTEHARASSTFSGAGTNGCAQCHNDSATVTAIVTGKWGTRNSTTGCSVCHANTDVTSAASAHLATANHAVGTAVTGCTQTAGAVALGAGCHGATITPDLTAAHAVAGSCTYAACHTATAFTPANKTCTNAACHLTTKYDTTTFVHNGTRGLIDGNDALHHSATGNALQTIGGYTQSTACTNCHSMTTLNTAHQTVHTGSGNLADGKVSCVECHNEAAPVNAVAIVTTNWSGKACVACHTAPTTHTTYASNHTATAGAGCVLATGCHGYVASQTLDIRGLHDVRVSGCSAAGPDTINPSNPACHALNKSFTTGTMTCGASGAGATQCHNLMTAGNHVTPHLATAGQSSGCVTGGCHTSYDAWLMHPWGASLPTCGGRCHDNSSYPGINPYASIVGFECKTCHNANVGVVGLPIEGGVGSKDYTIPGGHGTINHYATATSATTCGTGAGCHTFVDGNRDILNVHNWGTGNTLPQGCGGECHNDASANWPGIHPHTRAVDFDCVSCHNANVGSAVVYGGVFSKTFTTNHYVGTETSHTATAQGAVSTFNSTPCGSCHSMELNPEHTKATSGTLTCAGCHQRTGVPAIVAGYWSARTGTSACVACHGAVGTVPAPHADASPTAHTKAANASVGCGSSGIGCHPVNDMSQVGAPTTAANLHTDCVTCHDKNGSASYLGTNTNMVYNPAPGLTTCGAATGCHPSTTYNTTTWIHNNLGYAGAGLADGNDAAHHSATSGSQPSATYTYAGKSAACSACHSMVLGTEHTRASSTYSGAGATGCQKCHNDSTTVATIVKNGWGNKGTVTACSDCHANTDVTSAAAAHLNVGNHAATLANTGCTGVGGGCHGATANYDLTTVHVVGSSCTYSTCHSATTFNPATKTCSSVGCHVVANYNTTTYVHNGTRGLIDGNDTTYHVAGTLQGNATYTYAGKSAACTACHSMVLGTEHARASSTFSGAGTNGCAQCHNDSATVTAIVTGNWGTRNSTTGCSVCHANTDVTSAATAHLNVGNHVATLANTGCTAIGAGCHGATASYDLTTVHVVGSSCTYSTCHSATTFNPATKTCSSVGCHVVANYNTTTYVHNGTRGLIDGNDTTYHVAGALQGSAVYTLNGKSAACTACHSMVLGTEHARASSTFSGAGTNGCAQCHNDSATVTAIVTGKWGTRNSTTSCSVCHANTDATSAASAHSLTANHAVGTAVTGCTQTAGAVALGAGCHGATITPDLSNAHVVAGSCTYAACHTATTFTPANKTCTNAACHLTTKYDTTTFVHNGTRGLIDGNDATHHSATGNAGQSVAGYTNKTLCADCHSMTALNTAHQTVTVAAGNRSDGKVSCVECHNEAAPLNAVAIVTTNWSGKACAACHTTSHTTYTLATHQATAGAGCMLVNGCHGYVASQTLDIRGLHDAKATGCMAAGLDSVNATNPACHAVNKSMTAGTMTCGTSGAGALQCHNLMTANNHGSAPHTLATSTYNDVAMTGCTDSGVGCHGAVNPNGTTYAMVQYHPTAGGAGCSSTGACHNASATNHNDVLFNDPNTCQDCHSNGTGIWGTYADAPRVEGLTTTTLTGGHYDETLHTSTELTGFLTGGGPISANCIDCHKDSGGAILKLFRQHQAVNSTPGAVPGSSLVDDFETGNMAHWSNIDYTPASGGSGVAILNESWTSGSFVTNNWGASGGSFVAPGHGGAGDNLARISSDRNLAVSLTSQPINLSGSLTPRSISYYWKSANTLPATFIVAYSVNGGSTWTTDLTNATTSASWLFRTILIAAPSTQVMLRVTAVATGSSTGCTFDIDDIVFRDSTAVVAEVGWKVQTATKHLGTYGAQAVGATGNATTKYLTQSGPLCTPCASETLSYWVNYSGLAAADLLVQTTTDGTTYGTTVFSNTLATSSGWAQQSYILPNNVVGVRFAAKAGATTKMVYVDDVSLTPTAQAAVGGETLTCSGCHNHNAKTQSLVRTATFGGTAWDKTCSACHNATDLPGFEEVHKTTIPTVPSTSTNGCNVGGANCHPNDLHAIHKGNGTLPDPPCSTCHNYNLSGARPTQTSCGSAGDCHRGQHPEVAHDANIAAGTLIKDGTASYAAGSNDGCFSSTANVGCHFQDLRLEHGSGTYLNSLGFGSVTRAFDGASAGGDTRGCSICHSNLGVTAGTYANRTTIQSAITKGDKRCVTCHFETTDAAGTTGVKKAHIGTTALGNPLSVASQGTDYEFGTAGADLSGGGHNSYGVRFPNVSAFGMVGAVNVTGASAWAGLLGNGWTTASVVHCVDCHTKTAAPNGPQGAAVPFYLMDGTALSTWDQTDTAAGLTNTPGCVGPTLCHTSLAGLHGRGAHNTLVQCRNCHVIIPHAWRRPRLLRRVYGDNNVAGGTSAGVAADTAPYVDTTYDASASGFMKGTILLATPAFSSAASCSGGGTCGNHQVGGATSLWP